MADDERVRETVGRLLDRWRDTLASELTALVGDLLAAARADATAEVRARMEAELAAAVDRARRAADERWEAELAAARVQAERLAEERAAAVRAEAERILAAELADARRQAERRHADELAAARADAAAGVRASVERLVAALRQLDTAASLSEVLGLLVEHAAGEAGRVAVLLVQGARLRGWRAAGFSTFDPRTIDVSLADAGLLRRVVEEGAIGSLGGPEGDAADAQRAVIPLPAGRAAVAAPVRVGGQVVAVLYADDEVERDRVVGTVWPYAVEILARHAGRCLETLTALRAIGVAPRGAASRSGEAARMRGSAPTAGSPTAQSTAPPDDGDASARRYARLLVSEIKLYHEAAVQAGRAHRDLLQRLGPEIARARQLYEQRVPADIRARTSYFDQELLRTLADGDPTLLGDRWS